MPIPALAYMRFAHGATWRSGYATVCKTVYTSSILVVASIYLIDIIDFFMTSRRAPIRQRLVPPPACEARKFSITGPGKLSGNGGE